MPARRRPAQRANSETGPDSAVPTRARPVLQHFKTTERAIDILLSCPPDQDGLVRTRNVAKRLGISQHLVFKIVSRLARAELIICQRGQQGGFQLARPMNEITVGDVVRAIELCPEQDDLSDTETFSAARAAFDALLDSYTLADFTPRPADRPKSHL